MSIDLRRHSDRLEEARNLSAQGAGWEDILAALKNRITRLEARTAVFGPELARKMELRDAVRAKHGKGGIPAATRRWLEEAS